MINFIKKRRLWYTFSVLVIGAGLFSMVLNYQAMNHIFNLGIDFTGGTSMTLRFSANVEESSKELRGILSDIGLKKNAIQTAGLQDIIIKTEEIDVKKRTELFDLIRQKIASFEVMEVDIIGPSVGDQLRKTSIFILICVSLAILGYCSWRFEFVFGVASIVALLHDALVLFAVTAFFKFEMNVAYIAALLTVLGYSINDTIVIFDRIRERLRQQPSGEISKQLVNTAVNEMLPRSIHTSITTSLVVISLYLFGGVSLKVFSLVLMVGLITGTYSSLFIASPMVLTILKLKGAKIVQ
jgi:preprotein translocase subunit SecF